MRAVWFGSHTIQRLSSLLGQVGFPGVAPGLGAAPGAGQALGQGVNGLHAAVPGAEELLTAQGSLPTSQSLTALPRLPWPWHCSSLGWPCPKFSLVFTSPSTAV